MRATGEYETEAEGFDSALDDDYICFAASYGVDSGGKHHVLAFRRTPNKTNYDSDSNEGTDTEWIASGSEMNPMRVPNHWILLTDQMIYNTSQHPDHGKSVILSSYPYNSTLREEYGPDDIQIGRDMYGDDRYKDIYGGSNSANSTSWCRSDGVLLSVVRDGPIIKATTTKFKFSHDVNVTEGGVVKTKKYLNDRYHE